MPHYTGGTNGFTPRTGRLTFCLATGAIILGLVLLLFGIIAVQSSHREIPMGMTGVLHASSFAAIALDFGALIAYFQTGGFPSVSGRASEILDRVCPVLCGSFLCARKVGIGVTIADVCAKFKRDMLS